MSKIQEILKMVCNFLKVNKELQVDVCYQQDTKDEFKLSKIVNGDWIDVRAFKVENKTTGEIVVLGDEPYKYSAGDVLLVRLGFAMRLPEGYEGRLLPRSSTHQNFGFILTNGEGVIDNSYCGTNDEWMMRVYCTNDGEISLGDRVGQFRVIKKMPHLVLNEVTSLSDVNRGGYGSTGIK